MANKARSWVSRACLLVAIEPCWSLLTRSHTEGRVEPEEKEKNKPRLDRAFFFCGSRRGPPGPPVHQRHLHRPVYRQIFAAARYGHTSKELLDSPRVASKCLACETCHLQGFPAPLPFPPKKTALRCVSHLGDVYHIKVNPRRQTVCRGVLAEAGVRTSMT